jgi:hypothetical protein
MPYKIDLSKGVCSKTGVAVIDDSASLTLGEDGQVKMKGRTARTSIFLLSVTTIAGRFALCIP